MIVLIHDLKFAYGCLAKVLFWFEQLLFQPGQKIELRLKIVN